MNQWQSAADDVKRWRRKVTQAADAAAHQEAARKREPDSMLADANALVGEFLRAMHNAGEPGRKRLRRDAGVAEGSIGWRADHDEYKVIIAKYRKHLGLTTYTYWTYGSSTELGNHNAVLDGTWDGKPGRAKRASQHDLARLRRLLTSVLLDHSVALPRD